MFLSANEDMFNPVDSVEGYIDSIGLLEDFTLYEKTEILNKQEEFSYSYLF